MKSAMNEHMYLIGPWGWAGWALLGCMLLLYYRLWTSTSTVELRRMKEELAKARRMIEELQRLEHSLKNRNDELNTAHARLHGEFTELRGQFSQLTVAFNRQGEMVGKLMEDLKRERELRDNQYADLMRTKAQHGDL
jgi:predicted nuclease with TOPRIM domain